MAFLERFTSLDSPCGGIWLFSETVSGRGVVMVVYIWTTEDSFLFLEESHFTPTLPLAPPRPLEADQDGTDNFRTY